MKLFVNFCFVGERPSGPCEMFIILSDFCGFCVWYNCVCVCFFFF